MGWFWVGLVVVGGVMAWMSHAFFGVSPALTMGMMPLVFLLTILGVHATALTSITPDRFHGASGPTGAGVLAPLQVTANIALGAITADTTMHASTFCQHLRPGYLLGGNPRCQALGHVIGTAAGVFFCVPAFYWLLLRNDPAHLISDAYPFPAATVWMGVARILSGGPQDLPDQRRRRCPHRAADWVSCSPCRSHVGPPCRCPMGVGLAFLIPFHISLAIFVRCLVVLGVRSICRSPFRWTGSSLGSRPRSDLCGPDDRFRRRGNPRPRLRCPLALMEPSTGDCYGRFSRYAHFNELPNTPV